MVNLLGKKSSIEKRANFTFKYGNFYEKTLLPLEYAVMKNIPERRAYGENGTSVLIEKKGRRSRAFLFWEDAAQPISLEGDVDKMDAEEVYRIRDAALDRALHKAREILPSAEEKLTVALFMMTGGFILISLIILLSTGELPIIGDVL